MSESEESVSSIEETEQLPIICRTREIILTTEETGQLWDACVWDPSTGTALMTYKGANPAGPHAACFLGNDYLLLSDATKPVLNAWPVNSPEPERSVKLHCTGKVNAMAVTQDGYYCVTAVKKKLMVWQTASGAQLAVADRHFQPVTCVKFTSDGSHFVSGGEDGQALVWSLAYLLSHLSGEIFPEQTEPIYTFSDHGLPIQDIFVGLGGIKARLVTVSLDKSCRFYDLSCGQLLATFVLSYSLTAVAMNNVEDMAFLGAKNGKIFQLDLYSLPRTREHHVTDEEEGKVFVGHTMVITCLSISQDGMYLVSGSVDRQVIVWDIIARESIRTIVHKGTITNAFFAMAPIQMFSPIFNPLLVLCPFKKKSDKKENLIITVNTTEGQWERYKQFIKDNEEDDCDNAAGDDPTVQMDETKLKLKLMEATKKNGEIYRFAIEKIFKTLNTREEKGTIPFEEMETEVESSSSEDFKVHKKHNAQHKNEVTGKNKKKFVSHRK